MSSDSSQKRVVESVDDIHDTDSDGHRGKRSKIDKPFTSGSSSVRDTETSPSSLVSENKVHVVLRPKGDQAGGDSEAICSTAPQALSPKHLAPEPVQDPPQQCHNNNDKALQSTQEDKAEYICFGMLRDVDIQIQPVLGSYSLSVDQSFGIPDTFASLPLSIEPTRSDFLSNEGACVATIDYATHRRISSIQVEEDPIWLAVMPMDELRRKIRAVTKNFSSGSYSPSSWTYKINILAIGLSTIAKPLADQLTQPQRGRRELQLRCPVPKPDQIRYYNPQWSYTLGPPPSEQLKPPHTPRIANQKELNGSDEAGANKPNDFEDDRGDAQAVLECSSQQNLLNEACIDSRIQTELKSHQLEAVNFILSRETIYPHSSKKTLWRLENLDSGERVYKHEITGKISSRPEDIRGGILADDMGLGKTLSMIASIVTGLSCVEATLETPADTIPVPVKSTLVVVPTELILQGWIEEVEKHVTPGTLQCYKYHGSKRQFSLASPPLIVLATYDTVAAEFSKSEGGGVLKQVHWHRLILDEAHYIRNEDTLAFQAVNSLSASIRWCTTGTPIQNSLHDLASLVRFLRVPYLDSHAAFHEHIAKLSSSASADDICHRPHRNLELLLAVICLRRRFSTLFPDLQSTAITYRLSFSEVERRAYNELTRGCNGQLMAAVSMRMFCNTGMSSICLGGEVKDYDGDDQRSSLDTVVTLPQRGEVNIRSTYNTKILTSDSEDDVSDSQPSSPDSLFSLGPRHTLECQAFAQTKAGLVGEGESLYDLGTPNTTTTTTAATTPLPCDNEMEDCGQSEIAGPGFPLLVDMSQAGFIYPSKLVTLLANIRENYLEDKSIVFSFWTRSLDLVGRMFNENDISFCRIDGRMDSKQRQSVLRDFQCNPDVRVLLITIGAGAVGLNNLTVANRVHLLEPQWNPSVESQAIGRVLRQGQDKHVYVSRYIMKGTIEESIEHRQSEKKQLSLDEREIQKRDMLIY